MFYLLVPERGLEPPWVTPLAPKASASANFATPAYFYYILNYDMTKYKSKSCAPSRDRTYDLILKRDLLYQLSYGRILNYLITNNIIYHIVSLTTKTAMGAYYKTQLMLLRKCNRFSYFLQKLSSNFPVDKSCYCKYKYYYNNCCI